MPPKHMVVIDAGIAGLTAAFRLQQSDLIYANPHEGPVYFCGDYLAGLNTGAASGSG
jgi:predicted NAD/FAD-dependent oxidoreductase